jgi:hypothetical protein
VKEEHVQCKEEITNLSGIQIENLTRRNLFEDLGVDGSIMLKRILKGMGCEGVDRDRVSLSGCSEHGAESSVPVRSCDSSRAQ